MTSEEITLKILKTLEERSDLTQRELAAKLGVSLGRTHYLLRSLIDVGMIKLQRFQRSSNKWGYAYLLTPKGLAGKAVITLRYLNQKQEEFEKLQREIELLKAETDAYNSGE